MPASRKNNYADLARCLRNLDFMSGTLLRDASGLWLISQPATLIPDVVALVRALDREALPARAALGRLLGARTVLALKPLRLARWQYDLKYLQRASETLREGIRSGVPQLNSWREVSLDGRLALYQQQLTRLTELSTPEPETLSAWHLDQLLHVLGCEIPALPTALAYQRRDVPVREAACSHPRPATRRLASLIACARRQGVDTVGLEPDLQPWAGVHPRLFLLAAHHAPDRRAVFEAMSPEVLARITRLVIRLAILAGPEPAGSILDCAGSWYDTRSPLAGALEGFEALCARAEAGDPVLLLEPEDLSRRLLALPADPMRCSRELVRIHLEWMARIPRPARPISRRAMHRLVRPHLPEALADAAAALSALWREAEPVPPEPSPEWLSSAASLVLRFPLPLPALPSLAEQISCSPEEWLARLSLVSSDRLSDLLTALQTLQQRRPDLQGWGLLRAMPAALLTARLPSTLVCRSIALGVGAHVEALLSQPRRLSIYLDVVDELRVRMPGFAVTSDWFVRLFASQQGWLLGLVKAYTADLSDSDDVTMFALSQAIPMLDPSLESALESWETCVCGLPEEEVGRHAAVLGVEPEVVVAYLHYRRRLGHGETLSAGIERSLSQTHRRSREAAWIAARLQEPGLAAEESERLERRLVSLQGRGSESRRAGNQLRRSVEKMRRESLEATLDTALCARLERLLGLRLPQRPLSRPMRDALLLLLSEKTDFSLWKVLLGSAIRQTAPEDHPPNHDWLSRAGESGLDTARWCGGFRTQLSEGDHTLEVWTETDPLHILRMGSYFGTCLSLDGINAASTMVNALDINKHVIYARSQETGTIVARKLIGATGACELAGYETYLTPDLPEAFEPAIRTAITDFARQCGLTLSDTATPEVLHSGFWYDDGNASWSAPSQQRREEVDCDVLWRRVLASSDPEALRQLAEEGSIAASTRLLLLPEPPSLRELELHSYRQALIVLSWLEPRCWSCFLEIQAEEDDRAMVVFSILLSSAACSRDHIQRLFRYQRRFSGQPWADPSYTDFGTLGAVMPWCDMQALISLACAVADGFRNVADSGSSGQREPDWTFTRWPERLTEALYIVWLRDREIAPLRRALRGELPAIVERSIAELLEEVRAPALAPLLRTRLRRTVNREALAAALGNQGQPGDGPRILAVHREEPSLRLLVAIRRCGDPECVADAWSLWRAQQEPGRVFSGGRLSLLMEAIPERVHRHLRRQKARQESADIAASSVKQWEAMERLAADLTASTDPEATLQVLQQAMAMAERPSPPDLRRGIHALAARGATPAIRIQAIRWWLATEEQSSRPMLATILSALWTDAEITTCPPDFQAEMCALLLASLIRAHSEPGLFEVYRRWSEGCDEKLVSEAIRPFAEGFPRYWYYSAGMGISLGFLLLSLDHPQRGEAARRALSMRLAHTDSALYAARFINEAYCWLGDAPAVQPFLAQASQKLEGADLADILRDCEELIRPTLAWLLPLLARRIPEEQYAAFTEDLEEDLSGAIRPWALALWQQSREGIGAD